jgi:hypothetical protein
MNKISAETKYISKNYQRQYNALKRVGRCKMSLEDRAACEIKCHREIEGSRS